MRNAILLTLLFVSSLARGQKVIQKTILNAETISVLIDAANCFEINLSTVDTDEVTVAALIDGEYNRDLLVNIERKGATVAISAGFQPNFIRPNDKLSAHKVVSIALDIKLPKYKTVRLFGTNCNVSVSGVYENLNVSLNDGRCNLNKVSEMTEVTTQSGDIILIDDKATIRAQSKYGRVANGNIPKGDNQFILSTITGNIEIKKTE